MKKSSGLIYLIAAVMLIVVGIITTSLISSVKDRDSTTDIRAKAGNTNTLKLFGTISGVNDIEGTVIVTNVEFSRDSRSGDAKNYGTWTVTPPANFQFSSAAPGLSTTFTVETISFDVSSKKVAAVQMTIEE